MTDCILDDLSSQRSFRFQVNGERPTFRLRTERIAAAAVRDLDDAALDLLDVAAAVFYADGRISRGGNTREDMGADWHRNLRLTIPVRLPELWSQSDVSQTLVSAIDFMTGDHFTFRFVKNEELQNGPDFLDLDPSKGAFKAERVMMFSGGLDSFAGALETLETGSANVILVSHQSAPKVAARQRQLGQYLIQRFPDRIRHIMVPAHRAGEESKDTTQRSRSFLFAAMGCAIATTFGAGSVSFFENGIVSHNLPVSPQIVGSMASRTTHPLALARLQELINLILPDPPRISNPYEWMTKTEVVERISRFSAERMVEQAVSCTRVRDQSTLRTHCGCCSQCLDRRFAVLNARMADADPSTRYETDVILGPRDAGKATLSVEWTKHFLQLVEFDASGFLARFGTELSRIMDAYPSETRETLFKRIFDLHRRQAKIVLQVMKSQVEQNSAALAGRTLPPSCLLVLHLGQHADIWEPSKALVRQLSSDVRGNEDVWEEMPPLPGEPLTLIFSEQNGKQIVTVPGLCRFTSKIARVTFDLKTQHAIDKAEGLPPEDFRYIRLMSDKALVASKGQVRVLINRGRKKLESAYSEMHGEVPPRDLLFQTRQSRGYRLNPLTRVSSEE